jgi:hypothetical protein
MRMVAMAAAFVLAAVSASHAQQGVSNVSGFDAAKLAGKKCVGPFSVPKPGSNPNDLGALRVTFAVKDGMLGAHMERRFGRPAFADPNAVTSFEQIGAVKSLQIAYDKLTFLSTSGWPFTLTLQEAGGAIVMEGSFTPSAEAASAGWQGGTTKWTCL